MFFITICAAADGSGMEIEMFIIVGLGNPESKYAGTRHNIGFDTIDALAEKYQAALAAKKDRSYTSYSWNGGYYKKWLAKQDVEINDKIWDRVSVGNITLKHDKVNYVNGQDEKDSDENENRKK